MSINTFDNQEERTTNFNAFDYQKERTMNTNTSTVMNESSTGCDSAPTDTCAPPSILFLQEQGSDLIREALDAVRLISAAMFGTCWSDEEKMNEPQNLLDALVKQNTELRELNECLCRISEGLGIREVNR